jgi:MHS family proline/betaine transporter-like MFS transporter
LGIIHFATLLFLAVASYKIHPLKILRVIGCVFLGLAVCLPSLVNLATTCYHIFALQAAIVFFCINTSPAEAIFIKHFPVLRRITATSLLYSLTRAITYIITSFGLVYLTEYFGHYGLWFIMLPVTLSYLWAIGHYAVLENVSLPKLMSIFGCQKAACSN